MMKLFGALLVMGSGLCLGLRQAGELKKRVELLLDLKRTIQSFRTEIGYIARPLGEMILENRDSPFCRLAAESGDFLLEPKKALEQAGERLLREPPDLELYRGLVWGLGDSGVQGQLEHLDLYTALLENNLAAAREEREKKSRLYICLGLFGGVTLCLVLL